MKQKPQGTTHDLRAQLAALRDRLVRYLQRVCRRRGSEGDGVDDLTQQAYAAGLASVQTYRPEHGELGRWMFGVATNVERQAARRQRRDEARFAPDEGEIDDAAAELPSPERLAHMRAVLAKVAGAMAEMPLPLFAVFQMVAMEGATHEEVAERLGISVANSKKRLERAREFLEEKAGIRREDILTAMPLLVCGARIVELSRARWRAFYEASARGGHLTAALLAGVFLWATVPLAKVRREVKAAPVETTMATELPEVPAVEVPPLPRAPSLALVPPARPVVSQPAPTNCVDAAPPAPAPTVDLSGLTFLRRGDR